MAIRAIESRLESLSVNDENEPVNGGAIHPKSKVSLKVFDLQTIVLKVLGITIHSNVNIWTWI